MLNNHQENPVLKIGPNENNQSLYFFGANHSNDPSDSQFIQLQKFWAEFLDVTKENRIVFTERTINKVPPDYNDVIKLDGEGGAVQWLARQSNILAICPEPDSTQQRQSLCQKFDSHEVAYTFIAQYLGAWFRRTNPNKTFREATKDTLEREANFSDIYGFIPDNAWLIEQHKILFGDQNLEDGKFLNHITDPRKTDSKINIIVAARTEVRNDYILNKIQSVWNEGKSLFIVYGKGHATILFPQLQNLLNQKV